MPPVSSLTSTIMRISSSVTFSLWAEGSTPKRGASSRVVRSASHAMGTKSPAMTAARGARVKARGSALSAAMRRGIPREKVRMQNTPTTKTRNMRSVRPQRPCQNSWGGRGRLSAQRARKATAQRWQKV